MNIKMPQNDPATDVQDESGPFDMADGAVAASRYLRALANPSRLMLLCELHCGEKSVGELEAALNLSQAYVSQQLAKLRAEGLVTGRRDGRVVYYQVSDTKVRPIIQLLYRQFCAGDAAETST